MGRPKKPWRELKSGTLYLVDRRFLFFELQKRIVSRQRTRNGRTFPPERFFIEPSPVVTTLMVLSQEVFFGKDYVHVLAANSEGNTVVGYLPFTTFLKLARGKLTWTYSSTNKGVDPRKLG